MVAPVSEALAGPRGDLEDPSVVADVPEIRECRFAIESGGVGQVALRHEGHVGRVKQGGYLSGLSSPSVTDSSTTRKSSPRS